MPYSVRHLQYILAVKQSGSLARASELMSVSVSSVREAIRLTEQRLGVMLFFGTPSKGMQLTSEGERFTALAEDFLNSYIGFEKAAADIPLDWNRDITIGVLKSVGSLIMPSILRKISSIIPNAHFQIIESSARELSAAIRTEKLAAAFTFNDDLHPALEFVELYRTPLHAGLCPDHPLAERDEIELAELQDDPYILLDFDGARRYYSGLFERHNVKPRVTYTVDTREMAYSLISADLGYSIFNLCPLSNTPTPYDKLMARVPLVSDYWNPSFGMIHMSGRSGHLIQTLKDICVSFQPVLATSPAP
ncbi:LysR family transcriptional regulator [Brucella anthropi]|nr:LysR family transcriptional regulator [Brucella anthropi]